jgi:hypothetical protein
MNSTFSFNTPTYPNKYFSWIDSQTCSISQFLHVIVAQCRHMFAFLGIFLKENTMFLCSKCTVFKVPTRCFKAKDFTSPCAWRGSGRSAPSPQWRRGPRSRRSQSPATAVALETSLGKVCWENLEDSSAISCI